MNRIDELPQELYPFIFSFGSAFTLCQFGRVSRRCAEISEDNELWKYFLKADFRIVPDSRISCNCRALYRKYFIPLRSMRSAQPGEVIVHKASGEEWDDSTIKHPFFFDDQMFLFNRQGFTVYSSLTGELVQEKIPIGLLNFHILSKRHMGSQKTSLPHGNHSSFVFKKISSQYVVYANKTGLNFKADQGLGREFVFILVDMTSHKAVYCSDSWDGDFLKVQDDRYILYHTNKGIVKAVDLDRLEQSEKFAVSSSDQLLHPRYRAIYERFVKQSKECEISLFKYMGFVKDAHFYEGCTLFLSREKNRVVMVLDGEETEIFSDSSARSIEINRCFAHQLAIEVSYREHKLVKIFCMKKKKETHEIRIGHGSVYFSEIDSSKKLMVAFVPDSTGLGVWNLEAQKLEYTIPATSAVQSFQVFGERLAVVCDGECILWDLFHNQIVKKLPSSGEIKIVKMECPVICIKKENDLYFFDMLTGNHLTKIENISIDFHYKKARFIEKTMQRDKQIIKIWDYNRIGTDVKKPSTSPQ